MDPGAGEASEQHPGQPPTPTAMLGPLGSGQVGKELGAVQMSAFLARECRERCGAGPGAAESGLTTAGCILAPSEQRAHPCPQAMSRDSRQLHPVPDLAMGYWAARQCPEAYSCVAG